MIFSSIKNGLSQVWSNKRIIWVFFLFNFLFGVVMMLPGRFALSRFIGQSMMGAELGGRFNMDFLFEFLKNNPSVSSIYQGMFLVLPALYWLGLLFLSGGAFRIYTSGESYSSQRFWGDAANYFGRFVRLGIMSLLALGLMIGIQFLLVAGIKRLVFGSDPYEYVTYWSAWVSFGLRTVAILLFGIIIDYARIYAVTTGDRRMRVCFWQGVKFAFTRHCARTFSLAFVLFLAGAAVLAIYNPISNSLSAANALVVSLLFVVQQAYMFFRTILRLTLYASQADLYIHIAPPQTAPEPVEDSATDLGLEGAPA